MRRFIAVATNATLLASLACGEAEPLRFDRPTISGTVVLADQSGLSDMTRVTVDIGRGEGGLKPSADGQFEFTDVEPDAYTLRIAYAGGLTDAASASAYQPFETLVVAKLGSSISLGRIALSTGLGSVQGQLRSADSASTDAVIVRLSGPIVREATTSGGMFQFDAVPVGTYRVAVNDDRLRGSMQCAAEVTVAYDGHAVTPDAILVASSAVAVTVRTASAAIGGVWFVATPDVDLSVSAAFATRVRAWADGGTAPVYVPFTGVVPVRGLTEGNNVINVQLEDACGFESAPIAVRIVRDQTAPVVADVRLAGGRDFTATREIIMSIVAGDAASPRMQMRMTTCDVDANNTYDCSPELRAAPWRDFASALTISLPATEGLKGVQLELQDLAGNRTGIERRTVTYDATAPSEVRVTIGNGSGTIDTDTPRVLIAADGAAEMRLGTDPALASATWEPYAASLFFAFSPGNGVKDLYVQLRDAASNATAIIHASAVLDTTGRLSGRFLLDGVNDHSGVEVTLTGTAFFATTTSTGAWSIPSIPAGRYDLVARIAGFAPHRIFDLTVDARQTRDIGAATLTAIRGRIVGRVMLEGQPFHGGAEITVAGTNFSTFTDSSGGFVVTAPPRTFNGGLIAAKRRFASATYAQPIVVLEEQAFDVGTLMLSATGNDLVGNVSLAGRADHRGVRVRVVREADGSTIAVDLETLTSSTGRYAFEVLPLGRYGVTIAHATETGWESASFGGVTIAPGSATFLAPRVLRRRFLTIDGGATETRNRSVTLTLGASDCLSVRVANGADPTSAAWVPCPASETLAWMLTAADGLKTVSVQFLTSADPSTPTDVVSASIVLDATAEITSFMHDGTGRQLTLGDIVRFTLEAGEAGGRATVTVDGYASEIAMIEQTSGSFVLDLPLLLAIDLLDAPVSARFVDLLGNSVTATADPITVNIPPLIASVRVIADSVTREATVEWNTDEPTTGVLSWGADASYGTDETRATLATAHSVTFGGGALVPGVQYHFQIVATDAAGNTTQTQDTMFFLAPDAPSYVAAVPGIGRAWVRWEAPVQSNVTGYHVYRSTTAGGPYTALTATPYTHEALIFEDATVSNGTTYYYVVTSLDDFNSESDRSSESSATPAAASSGPTVITEPLLRGTTILSELGSPYMIDQSISGEEGGMLVIGPGTELLFAKEPAHANRHRLIALGRLVIFGVPSKQVTLRSSEAVPAAVDWAQIRLETTSPDGRLDLDTGRYFAGNLIYETLIRESGSGNRGWEVVHANGTDLAVMRSTITQHQQEALRNSGDLLVTSSILSFGQGGVYNEGALGMFDTMIVDQSAEGIENNGTTRRATIEDTTFARNRYGILNGTVRIRRSSFTAHTQTALSGVRGFVASSTIADNPNLAVLALVDIVDSLIQNNEYHPRTTGLYQSRLVNNVGGGWITGEAIGCRFEMAAGATEAATRVEENAVAMWNHFSGGGAVPYLQLVTRRSTARNNSFEIPATATSVAVLTTRNVASEVIDATGNWWDTTVTAEMVAGGPMANISAIDDQFDTATRARIDYSNWAVSALPLVRIDAPQWASRHALGAPITFIGWATDAEDGVITQLEWRDDSGDVLGAGATLVIDSLSVGTHRIWLFATDSDGQEAAMVRSVEVVQ